MHIWIKKGAPDEHIRWFSLVSLMASREPHASWSAAALLSTSFPPRRSISWNWSKKDLIPMGAIGPFSQELMQEAFLYACGYGANRVLEFLLPRVDLAGHTGDGQTGAHYAVIFGQLDTLRFLLKRNPPLGDKNMYDGTVLGQTLWSAGHGGDPKLYIRSSRH
jgi:hypothetical protein